MEWCKQPLLAIQNNFEVKDKLLQFHKLDYLIKHLGLYIHKQKKKKIFAIIQ
jgi:hypothetical protein